jgi:DNA-binding transcriptional regulator GbsR (MarR family)
LKNAGILLRTSQQRRSPISTPENIQHYIEDFGLYFENFGLPRTAGRILGWLLVCDPPQQTMPDLVQALQVSKSSVSTASRLLIQAKLVERVSLPGERKDYYRVKKGAWVTAMQLKMAQIPEMQKFAEQGLALLDNHPAERRERLQEMHSLYTFFEQRFPELIAEWLELQQPSS